MAGRRKLIPAAAIVGCMLAVSVAAVAWTGMGSAVEKRLAALGSEQKFADARLTNWCDALRATQAFPVLGTGFGTFRFAYRPFQRRHHDVWFQHAENQYLRAQVEGGVLGLILLVAAIAIVFHNVPGNRQAVDRRVNPRMHDKHCVQAATAGHLSRSRSLDRPCADRIVQLL